MFPAKQHLAGFNDQPHHHIGRPGGEHSVGPQQQQQQQASGGEHITAQRGCTPADGGHLPGPPGAHCSVQTVLAGTITQQQRGESGLWAWWWWPLCGHLVYLGPGFRPCTSFILVQSNVSMNVMALCIPIHLSFCWSFLVCWNLLWGQALRNRLMVKRKWQ